MTVVRCLLLAVVMNSQQRLAIALLGALTTGCLDQPEDALDGEKSDQPFRSKHSFMIRQQIDLRQFGTTMMRSKDCAVDVTANDGEWFRTGVTDQWGRWALEMDVRGTATLTVAFAYPEYGPAPLVVSADFSPTQNTNHWVDLRFLGRDVNAPKLSIFDAPQ